MVSTPKIIGEMSCALTLCLGLAHAAQADDAASVSDTLKAGQSDRGKAGKGLVNHK